MCMSIVGCVLISNTRLPILHSCDILSPMYLFSIQYATDDHKNASKFTNVCDNLIRYPIKSHNLSLVVQSVRIGENEILSAS